MGGDSTKLVKGEAWGLCGVRTRCVTNLPTLGLRSVATHQGRSDRLEELLH